MNKQNDLWFFVENDTRGDIICGRENAKMNWEGGIYTSRSGGCESKDKLIEKLGILEKPCLECGRPINTHYVTEVKNRLIAKNLCFKCNFWDEYVKTAADPTHLRIKGSHYVAHEATKGNTSWNGFGGQKFKIEKSNGDIIETNNLWHQGEIPAHFQERLKDNAKFIYD